MMTTLEELKLDMKSLINKIAGLVAILITDSLGVPILKVPLELAHEISTRPALMSSFAIGSDQAGKMGIGQCKTMTCQYDNYQIVHFNKHPLVVALIADNKANTGMLLALEGEFDAICNELKKCLDSN